MAWIAVDYDDTLVQDFGDGQEAPVEGAIEAMQQLAAQGHRLTIFTSRFAPMPESEKQRLKDQIEEEVVAWGFPPMEVWTGTTKPPADLYIDDKAVTFDGDWPLAMTQAQYMLEEMGLVPATGLDTAGAQQPEAGMEEVPPEEEEPADGDVPPAPR